VVNPLSSSSYPRKRARCNFFQRLSDVVA